MTSQQKIVPWIVLLFLVGTVGYTFIPFKFADTVDCEAPIYGSDPLDLRGPVEGLIRPKLDCPAKGRSRLTVAAFTALITSAAGVALVGLRPTSGSCLAGNHGDCREWWAGTMGELGRAFSCHCDCHGGYGGTDWSAA